MNCADLVGKIDFAIITIKPEEFKAVLERFPPKYRPDGGERQYSVCVLKARGNRTYLVATVAATRPGNEESAAVAESVIKDLAPRFIVFVGIAGGLPHEDTRLGDVVVANKVADLRVMAHTPAGPEISPWIGFSDEAAKVVADLPALRGMKEWWTKKAIGRPLPAYDPGAALKKRAVRRLKAEYSKYYDRLVDVLRKQAGQRPRLPQVHAATIGAADVLHKAPELLEAWLSVDRTIRAVDMESAGARIAEKRRTPFLVVRSISDIPGVPRDNAWTLAACQIAASFAHAWLSAGPIPSVPGRSIPTRQTPSRAQRRSNAPASRAAEPVAAGPAQAVEVEPTLHHYNIEKADTLDRYARRSNEPDDETAMTAILERLNMPWKEPLPPSEAQLLRTTLFRPDVNYPSPDFVVRGLAAANPLLVAAADAIRSVARWPDSYRLNYVRQLSTTNLTCGLDANHSRLAHCLGVLDMATCMLDALLRNSPGVLELERQEDREWVVATLLFAFIHDRFHGPLGHSLDQMSYALWRVPAVGKRETESAFRKLDKMALESELTEAADKLYGDHLISRIVRFVAQDLEQAGFGVDGKAILEKLPLFVRLTERSEMPPHLRFLQDVVDGELDADRLDYLWRDTLHLGFRQELAPELHDVLGLSEAPASRVDDSPSPLGDLVASVTVQEKEGGRRLAFGGHLKKTVSAALLLRFIYYLRVYETPEKRIYDELLARVIYSALDAGGLVQHGRVTTKKLATELRLLTDDDLFHFLYESSTRQAHRGRAKAFSTILPMVHDVVQARPWQIVWNIEYRESDRRREEGLRVHLGTLAAAIDSGRTPNPAKDERARTSKATLRQLAMAGLDGTLPALFGRYGRAPPSQPYSEASPVFHFVEWFRGSFESRYLAEGALWAQLEADADIAKVIKQYEVSSGLGHDGPTPKLITIGLVQTHPPSVENVLFGPARGEASPIPEAWAAWAKDQATLSVFVAAHPALTSLKERVRDIVSGWFKRLAYLDLGEA